MRTAALVSLIWATQLKTTNEELLLVREGNITVKKQFVGIFEVALLNGCSMQQQTIIELLKCFLNIINGSRDFSKETTFMLLFGFQYNTDGRTSSCKSFVEPSHS